MDFTSLNILSGKDEIFSFKRAVSRLQEIQSAIYQSSVHRPQEFLPYLGTVDEVERAKEKRGEREVRRREKFRQILEDEGLLDERSDVEGVDRDRVNMRNYTDTDWGDEASYKTLSREVDAVQKLRRKPPNFGEQHFWGFGWWE